MRVIFRGPAKGRLQRQADATRAGTSTEATTAAIEALQAEQCVAVTELRLMREELRLSRVEIADTKKALLEVLRVVVDDEMAIRRLLAKARRGEGYEDAWTDPEPLISVVIPTYRSWETLETRALPSVLAQTYGNVEVVVVGDAAPEETAAAVARVGDPRVRFENLTIRGPYPEDERKRWFVAGTGPMNQGMRLARGAWTAFLNDDDAFRPDHLEVLLAEVRRTKAEVGYSKLLMHSPSDAAVEAGEFPPGNHKFGWQLALEHSALRLFEFELVASEFDEPGDWYRARRMIRAGVRFSQVDRVTVDYFPSLLWSTEG